MDSGRSARVPGSRRVLLTGFGAFLLGVLGMVTFFFMNFRSVQVNGESMEPTFASGRRLLMSSAYWLVGSIRKNDIVVARVPETGELLIKRVKGLPGEVVDYMDVPYEWKVSDGEYKVPEDSYYLLGDNRPMSQDSRDYGPFESSQIVGKVVVYGNEPWLMGFLGAAAVAIVASLAAAALESRGRGLAT